MTEKVTPHASIAQRVVWSIEGQCCSAFAHHNCRFAGATVVRDGVDIPMCAKPPERSCEYFAGKIGRRLPVYD